MKRFTAGLLLLFLLAACSSTPEVQPAPGFTFTVDPGAETARVTTTEGVSSQQAEGRRTLVPGQDLDIIDASYTFLPGNVLIIEANFKNLSDQTFTELSFSRADGSNVINSTEPGMVEALNPGEATGLLRFEVQHRGQSFTYEVVIEGAAEEPDGAEACVDPVNVPDDYLLYRIRIKLGFSENEKVTCADLASLTELDIEAEYDEDGAFPPFRVTDLEGLQYAVNLTSLSLTGNEILKDVSQLSGLTKLVTLDLRGNNVTDLSPLGSLVNLKELILTGNYGRFPDYVDLTDLNPLSELVGLERLELGGNQIEDLAPLSVLTNLVTLDLDLNRISDISPLVDNSGLGAEEDIVELSGNCLDLAPGSQALENAEVIEARNPDVQNVFLDSQLPQRCDGV